MTRNTTLWDPFTALARMDREFDDLFGIVVDEVKIIARAADHAVGARAAIERVIACEAV